MTSLWCVALALLLGLPALAVGADDAPLYDREASEHFSLFDGCRPMAVFVRPLRGEARQLGLAEEALHLAAAGRLRAAGLYDARARNAIGVGVRTTGPAFHVRAEYLRVLQAPEWGLSGHAITWESGTHGLHGGSANHVLAILHRHLDRFVGAFRRVNAEACGKR